MIDDPPPQNYYYFGLFVYHHAKDRHVNRPIRWGLSITNFILSLFSFFLLCFPSLIVSFVVVFFLFEKMNIVIGMVIIGHP